MNNDGYLKKIVKKINEMNMSEEEYLKESMEKFSEKTTEDGFAFSIIYSELKEKYPNKFPNENIGGSFGNGKMEIVGVNIKKEEIFEKEVKINGKNKKYKVTLRNISPKEYDAEKKAEERKIELENKKSIKKDDDDFKSMFKWAGLIALIIVLYYLFTRFIG